MFKERQSSEARVLAYGSSALLSFGVVVWGKQPKYINFDAERPNGDVCSFLVPFTSTKEKT